MVVNEWGDFKPLLTNLQPLATMKFQTTLTDLDELLFQVRDKNSGLYIAEAINAYKGGAFRTAIVSVWIAVAYDIISKIREIANQGDGKADSFIRIFDGYTSNITDAHIKKLQEIENSLLDNAFKEYEFINKYEYANLSRLKDDRNNCAHPAFYDNDTLYQPEPELTRMYIVQAVTYLLRHPPMQGKSSLDKIQEEIERASFPRDKERIYGLLNDRYLSRSKNVLVKNLLKIVLSKILYEINKIEEKEKWINILLAIQRGRTNDYEEYMPDILSDKIKKCNDQQLRRIVFILNEIPTCWDFIENSHQIQIEETIKELVLNINSSSYLKSEACSFVSNFVSKIPYIKNTIIPEALRLYREAGSYREAEAIGNGIIIPIIHSFSEEHILNVINTIKENDQVEDARGTRSIITEIFNKVYAKFPLLSNAWVELINTVDCHDYKELRKNMEDKGIIEKSAEQDKTM